MDPRVEVARLAVGVMAADGCVERRELEASGILDSLGLGGLTPFVRRELERLERHPIDVEEACEGLRGIHPEAAATLVGALTQVAACDGEISLDEARVLDVIGRRLGLVPDDVRAVVESVVRGHPAWRRPEPPTRDEPPVRQEERPPGEPVPGDGDVAEASEMARRVLGLPANASRAAVDAAYLDQMARYDPVKVSQLGPEFAALAARKLFEVTLAWETLVGAPG